MELRRVSEISGPASQIKHHALLLRSALAAAQPLNPQSAIRNPQ